MFKPKAITKEDYFSNKSSISKKLVDTNSEVIINEYNKFGLIPLLNGIVGKSVPSEKEEVILLTNNINIDYYIMTNLSSFIISLVIILNGKDLMVTKLGDAFWEIYNDSAINYFEPPSPENTNNQTISTTSTTSTTQFDFNKHDKSLESFKSILIKHLNIITENDQNITKTKSETLVLICYARSIFECRSFQAPPRLTMEQAIRDSQSREHFWEEYMKIWNITKYFI